MPAISDIRYTVTRTLQCLNCGDVDTYFWEIPINQNVDIPHIEITRSLKAIMHRDMIRLTQGELECMSCRQLAPFKIMGEPHYREVPTWT